MKFINGELIQLFKNSQGFYYFLVGNQAIWVHKSLLKPGKPSSWYKRAEDNVIIDITKEVDIDVTQMGNIVIVPYDKVNVRANYKYLVFFKVGYFILNALGYKVTNGSVIADNDGEMTGGLVSFTKILFAADDDTILSVERTSITENYIIRNDKIVESVVDTELEALINE